MNFAPYVKHVRMNYPVKTEGHCILLVRSGSKLLNVSFNDYNLKKGSLCIIPDNSIVVNKEQSDDYNLRSLIFYLPLEENTNLLPYDGFAIQLTSKNYSLVENYFQLLHLLTTSKRNKQQNINHIIISLLYTINEWREEQNVFIFPERKGREEELSEKFVRIIATGGIPERKPEYYAKKLCVSKGYLSQAVRKRTQKTVLQWINERTMMEAKLMLNTTDKTLDEIAVSLHLNNASQFIKFFQLQEGVTPTQYRRTISSTIGFF